VTVVIVAALLIVGIVATASGHRGVFSTRLAGIDPADVRELHWWPLITSTLEAGSVLQFAIAIVAAVFGIGAAERMMGSVRTVVAFLVTGIVATASASASNWPAPGWGSSGHRRCTGWSPWTR
jgi:phosphatidylglycerol lysyltransferase